jgi:hypothetical protein
MVKFLDTAEGNVSMICIDIEIRNIRFAPST